MKLIMNTEQMNTVAKIVEILNEELEEHQSLRYCFSHNSSFFELTDLRVTIRTHHEDCVKDKYTLYLIDRDGCKFKVFGKKKF